MNDLESLRHFIMEEFQDWGGPPEADRRGGVSITGIMNGGEGSEGSDTEDTTTYNDNTETPETVDSLPAKIGFKTVDPGSEGRDVSRED